jgi:endonuclease I
MPATGLQLWLLDENGKILKKLISIAFGLTVLSFCLSVIIFVLTVLVPNYGHYEEKASYKADEDSVKVATDNLDQYSELVVDEELPLVIQNCTACHSAKLVAQNRATREGWKNIIVWMQETQNLWDLGSSEDKILDYLARHYAPEKTGRRKNLQNIEWYELKEPGK